MSSLQLWPKQQEALEFALGKDSVALLCQQRTGKTFVTMAILEAIMEELEELVGVLVCLLNNKESTWVDGLTEFLPQLQIFTDLASFRKAQGHRILLVHFEQLPRIIDKLVRYKKLNWAGIDEAHRIYNKSSKQSRAAGRLSWVPRKLILTGTPIEKQPQDLWAQFRFLKPEVFGTRWEDFEKEFLEYPKLENRYRPGTVAWQRRVLQQRILRSKAKFRFKDRLKKFQALVGPYCLRLTKKDVDIKPPKVKKILVEMRGHQRRCYQEIARDGVTQTPGGLSVIAPMEGTREMKKRQIASGFVYDQDGELEYLGGAKRRKILELFEELPKPVVIFTAFKPDTDRIHGELRRLGYRVPKVSGSTKKKLRPQIWRSFQKGRYDGIVCQIRTGGVGVDLWKSNHAIVGSMTYSFIDWDQAISRMDSRFKRKAASIWVVCSKNSVDEELFDLVFDKAFTGETVMSPFTKRR